MKLSNFILDVGRVVAYYPNLKKVTQSTTATILLCQLLYWSKPNENKGWVYKTSEEIEEETGLTYNEQRTAKKALTDLNLMEQEVKKLDHTTAYRINIKELNRQWELVNGRDYNEEEEVIPEPIKEEPIKEEYKPVVVEKKGDLVDAVLFYANSSGAKKEIAMNEIRNKISMNLHVNPDTKEWEQFIKHAYDREVNFNEPVDTFIKWAIENEFNPIYWPPKKMITMYPQAYVVKERSKPEEFVKPIIKQEETEELIGMPRSLGRKKE